VILVRTPLRLSFYGGSTDYPVWADTHGGSVLSTTIDKFTYLSVRRLPPFFNHKSRIVWSEIELVNDIPEIHHPSARECLRFCGIREGVEIHYDGDLPARSGLGSSSSFTVGLLNALHALNGKMVSKKQLAQEAIYVEQEMIGEVVGYQDQVSASYGGLNRIDFDAKGFHVRPIIVPDAVVEGLQRYLMLIYTGEARNASDIAREQVALTPQKETELTIMQDMVNLATERLTEGDIVAFGELMHENWKLKKSLSPKITTTTADLIYGKALAAGAISGKIAGAGGGGFMLLFVPPERRDEVRTALRGFLEVPFAFETQGSRVIYYDSDESVAGPRIPVSTLPFAVNSGSN
jgi:D-glycero-alpha-D-manno-heptose-7-phosphate kinase